MTDSALINIVVVVAFVFCFQSVIFLYVLHLVVTGKGLRRSRDEEPRHTTGPRLIQTPADIARGN